MIPDRCPRCGMPREEWSNEDGVPGRSDEQVYCCSGCADNEECLCPRPVPADDAQAQEETFMQPALEEREAMLSPASPSLDDDNEQVPITNDQEPKDKQPSYKTRPNGPPGVSNPEENIEDQTALEPDVTRSDRGEPPVGPDVIRKSRILTADGNPPVLPPAPRRRRVHRHAKRQAMPKRQASSAARSRPRRRGRVSH